MMRSRRRTGEHKGRCATSGFTLVEAVVVVAILSVVFIGISQLFMAGYQSQAVISTDSAQLDNARRAVDAIARDIRVAGLDPTGAGIFGFNTSGFTPVATESVVLFSLDQDRDGTLDSNALERVGFLLSGGNVVRTMNGGSAAAGFPPIARNVAGLRFEYFDGADNPIPNPAGPTYTLTPAQRLNIRRVRVLVTFSGTAGGLARNYQVTTDVRARNL